MVEPGAPGAAPAGAGLVAVVGLGMLSVRAAVVDMPPILPCLLAPSHAQACRAPDPDTGGAGPGRLPARARRAGEGAHPAGAAPSPAVHGSARGRPAPSAGRPRGAARLSAG
ncbi:hypothetical protein MANAM107_08660 [Actinomyces capricornis]|uniref:Uncharacterized protein n=1 Tax=Actinomyces capricornis TaxID=2755559 RepID=A0ABN6K5X3_9ACTO|nr:hypothetical protein MANAM107_08660 [Actinomyces capricornis]